MTDVSLIDPANLRVTTVGIQGPSGPPGPDGPGFSSRMGNFYALAPTATTIPLISSSAYAFLIGGLRNLKVSGGSLTVSIQINGVDVAGLSGLSVTTTPQDPAATEANAINVGDRMTIVVANVIGAADLEFTMY